MFFLKQSTAVDIKLGPFVDKTDGVAYETGMAAAMDHATTGVRLSKNGGAFGDRSEGTEPVYDAFGYYLVKLDTTDTNTVGTLRVIFGDAAVCLPCEAQFQVVEEGIFDSLFAASAVGFDANQRVNVGQWLSQAVTLSTGNKPDVNIDEISDDTTAPGNLELMFDGTGYAGGTAKLAVDVDTVKTQTVTCSAPITVLASVGTAATSTAQTGDSFPLVSTEVAEIYAAVITNAAGADIAADIIAMKVDTAAILADTGTDGVVVATASKSGYELSTAGVDAILDDAPASELASVPSTTATLRQMLQYLFTYFRNKKTVTATTETLFKEDASTSLGTATVSDDGTTFTKGEMG